MTLINSLQTENEFFEWIGEKLSKPQRPTDKWRSDYDSKTGQFYLCHNFGLSFFYTGIPDSIGNKLKSGQYSDWTTLLDILIQLAKN